MEKLKYPIGKFVKPEKPTKTHLEKCISVIEQFPLLLRTETHNLTDGQLDTKYRPEGWTIRQVVNHCADSHMNAMIRFKWALTEDNPTIKPYFEDRWAELTDSTSISIEPALNLLDGLHKRWVNLLRSLSDKQLQITFVHPEHEKISRLDETIALYSWHCEHHLAHITHLKLRKQWV